MSVRVTPWKKTSNKFMVTIRFRWPDPKEKPLRDRKVIEARSEAAAKKWGEERESHLRAEGPPKRETPEREQPAKKVPTVAEFASLFVEDYARADGHGEGGIEAKESILRIHVVPHVGHLRLDELKPPVIQRLKKIWREGVTVNGEELVKPTGRIKSLNNRLSVVGKMLKVAVEWGKLPALPCEVRLIRGDDTEEMGFYEHPVYEGLVDGGVKAGEAALLVVLLGGDAGLRRGELLGLKQTDIINGKLHVQRQVYFAKVKGTKTRKPVVTPTKGKQKRWIPLTPRLAAALARHRHLRGPWVLSDERGGHLTPKLLRKLMERAETRAGMERTGGLHILRHTFCSHLAMAGASALSIQNLAGHESLETTMKYMHLSRDAADEAIEQLVKGRSVKVKATPTSAAG